MTCASLSYVPCWGDSKDSYRRDGARQVSKRQKHPDKEYERLLQSLEGLGWTVFWGRRHIRVRCGCKLSAHATSIPMTPSDWRAMKNLRGQLKRTGHAAI